jgi:hypothetical protein
MARLWMPKIAPAVAAPEASVRAMAWPEAQAWCNFVLFHPDHAPAGMAIEDGVVRPEAPPGRVPGADAARSPWSATNRSAHRCELAGGGRRVRIKQFLYDWAPPAFDHPSLWKSATRGFPIRTHVGWLGRDYRGLPAAAVSLDRTTIEISVVEGQCHDAELIELCHGLRPVAAEARAAILATPFGRLAYAARHTDEIVAVPVGYWRHQRAPRDLPMTIHTVDEELPAVPGRQLRPPAPFHLDTIFRFGAADAPVEVELLHEDGNDRGRYVRVLASPASTPGGVRFPPSVVAEQPCTQRTFMCAQHRIHHAYREPAFGPHELVFQCDGLNVMVLVKPAEWTDMAWLERFTGEMLASRGLP